ncbi:MAG: permease-like cell division protein FtsX [Gammaproteobacteria bacterium]|nr:permease-like cell division protein FtsX [Gammaproteobacteria bacterium]MBU6508897.1 permease-like cell division protein FtsX [Gammaproteobacteria bacterium]MDE1983327.1 permease-like cell division protein FtsX [Gammaproteobacteria bacterium]MDE2109060.1 permease-like cell division protein FtsX [Gammaproteobacteria bacterium]MDE2461116.1 permease-like cell division protein FtsX [Gammaproteobacteria bacterium]
MPARDSGAQLNRRTLGQRLRAYLHHHRLTLLRGFTQLGQHPLATFMTVAVIGIALALPAGALVLVNNARGLSAGWQGTARLSLFLKTSVSDAAVQQLAEQVRAHAGVASVQVISAQQSLADFQQRSGFNDTLSLLGNNPLPAVLVIQPTPEASTPAAARALAQSFAALPQVDQVRMDVQWLKRLQAILALLHRGVLSVAVLLAIAVVLIVGNTIRLEIENRRAEIEVSKLLGATDRFIRRPFLYHGAWYGVTGGVLAWILVLIGLALMGGPVGRLASLYSSHFSLSGLGVDGVLDLLVSGIVLGWLGSWLAVARHLRAIEPT